jgi:hypothetical protein
LWFEKLGNGSRSDDHEQKNNGLFFWLKYLENKAKW